MSDLIIAFDIDGVIVQDINTKRSKEDQLKGVHAREFFRPILPVVAILDALKPKDYWFITGRPECDSRQTMDYMKEHFLDLNWCPILLGNKKVATHEQSAAFKLEQCVFRSVNVFIESNPKVVALMKADLAKYHPTYNLKIFTLAELILSGLQCEIES